MTSEEISHIINSPFNHILMQFLQNFPRFCPKHPSEFLSAFLKISLKIITSSKFAKYFVNCVTAHAWHEYICEAGYVKLRIHSQTPLANIVLGNMFGKLIFPRTSGEAGENDKPTVPAVT